MYEKPYLCHTLTETTSTHWSSDYIVKPFTNIEKLKEFLSENGLTEERDSTTIRCWNPSANNQYGLNRISWNSGSKSSQFTKTPPTLKIQFITNSLNGNYKPLETFLLNLAKACNISEYIGNETKKGTPIYIPNIQNQSIKYKVIPKVKNLVTSIKYEPFNPNLIEKKTNKIEDLCAQMGF